MPKKTFKPKTVGKVHGKPKNWLKDPRDYEFYNSRKWRKFSLAFKMQNPVCKYCTQPAAFTDHIDPISEGGSKWDWDNLQALCKSCNGSKTAKQKKTPQKRL